MSGFTNEVVNANNVDFSGGSPVSAKLVSNGQMLIGATVLNTGGTHINVGTITSPGGTLTVGYSSPNITLDVSGGSSVSSLVGGPGITISGTATVPIVNSVIFTDTAAATLAVDNGYNATAAGTYPMPATAVQGEMIIVFCDTSGAVVLDCPALNFIRIGSLITSSGGTVTSTSQGDSLTLRYRLSTLTWEATSVIGTWLVA